MTRRRPGFGPRLLDLVACPEDGHWPLGLETVTERAYPQALVARRKPFCSDHCGRLSVPLEQLQAPPPCDECLATEVSRGALTCAACGRSYPIDAAIASFMTGSTPTTSEEETRDAEAEIYDDLYPDAEYVHELETYRRLLEPAPDNLVLDVGCGTGRVVKEYAREVAETVCLDFSRLSLVRLLEREDLPPGTLTWPLRADATRLPLRPGLFSKVLCLSVICFLPGTELQRNLVATMARSLKANGSLIISTYNYALVKRLWALAGRTEGALKQGTHSGGGIPYVNHTPAELRSLLAPHFESGPVHGICHRIPLLSNRSPRLAALLDGLTARLPLGRWFFATETVTRAEQARR